MIWLGLIVLLSWGSVGSVCVCEQSPRTSLLRGLFSMFISLKVMACLTNNSFPDCTLAYQISCINMLPDLTDDVTSLFPTYTLAFLDPCV